MDSFDAQVKIWANELPEPVQTDLRKAWSLIWAVEGRETWLRARDWLRRNINFKPADIEAGWLEVPEQRKSSGLRVRTLLLDCCGTIQTAKGHLTVNKYVTQQIHAVAIILGLVLCGQVNSHAQTAPAGLKQYDFGNPNDDETAMLEYINRARRNPTAEGERLAALIVPGSGIEFDPAEVRATFASYQARAPLAFNALLNQIAKEHTDDMISMGVLSHVGSDGSTPQTRGAAAGYGRQVAENAAGSPTNPSLSPLYTHYAYMGDLAHRNNVLNFVGLGTTEIGVNYVNEHGWNTCDFGDKETHVLATGVVYTDSDGDNFYTQGEGKGNVVVTANGASSYYTVTSSSGAYSLPLDLLPAYDPAKPIGNVLITFTEVDGAVHTETASLVHSVDQNGWSYQLNGVDRYDNLAADYVVPGDDGTQPGGGGGTGGGTGGGVITPEPPIVSVVGSSDGLVQFTVTRTGDTSQKIKVHYHLGGSALPGEDYMPLSGVAKIGAGKTSKTITIHTLPGATGVIKVKLTPASGYGFGAKQAKIRLRN